MTALTLPSPRRWRRQTFQPSARIPTRRSYLMCRPEHFAVTYAINPWMDPSQPVDRSAALRQWDELVATYRELGHEVLAVDPAPGLPDMVFAANAAFVIDGIALGARFANRERAHEARLYREYLQTAGITVQEPTYVNEGEGDLLLESDVILAGTGFRTDARAHDEVAALTGRQVVTLRLVDPRYYHLDTALCVLGDGQIAYLPEAFDGESRTQLARRYPDAILAEVADAEVLGLNAVSDGRNVVINREAENLAAALAARGYNPIPIDLSELRKAGGGPKCCTLELGGFRPTGR